ncbi:MAG: AMIN domain-containing protein [bacterium]|nr:AMIN domain-containing protein [bacterium]
MKTVKLLISLCFAAAMLPGPAIFSQDSNIKILKKVEISINSEKIKLETPVIEKNRIQFIPLRDILPALKGSITYLRKDNLYILITKKPDFKCTIIPHYKKIEYLDNEHDISSPPFFYKNRLYVPVKDLFSLLGFSIGVKNRIITIQTTEPPSITSTSTSKTVKKEIPDIKTRGSVVKKKLPPPVLTKKTREHNLALYFTKYKHVLKKNKYFYKNNVLYVNLTEMIKKHGYTVSRKKDFITVGYNRKKYIFSSKKSYVTIKSKKNQKKISCPDKIIIKNRTIFFPVKSFARALGFSIYSNKKRDEIHLLSKIKNIRLINKKKRFSVQILSDNILKPAKPHKIHWHKGFYVDIPGAFSEAAKKNINVNKGPVQSFMCNQLNKTTVRIHVLLKRYLPYSQIAEKNYGAEIEFYNTITKIKESIQKDKITITIKARDAIKASVWSTNKPYRLIVDIPNSISDLPQIIRSRQYIYKRIRTSQFKNNPPRTRIVFDLVKKNRFSYKINGNVLKITFPKTKKTVLSRAGKKTKRLNSIKNKVIVIDAGHGGRDPGGVSKIDGSYEKKYTLDIAYRLKKLLSKSGAFPIMVRKSDKTIRLRQRTRIVNKNNADAMVSIHINSFFKPYAKGTECYYYKKKDKRLAKYIQRELVRDLKLSNNGTKRARLYLLRNSKMPATLVEPAFITNKKEAKLLRSPAFRQKIANSIHKGLKKYFKQK